MEPKSRDFYSEAQLFVAAEARMAISDGSFVHDLFLLIPRTWKRVKPGKYV
jgi:hypothetical protein